MTRPQRTTRPPKTMTAAGPVTVSVCRYPHTEAGCDQPDFCGEWWPTARRYIRTDPPYSVTDVRETVRVQWGDWWTRGSKT